MRRLLLVGAMVATFSFAAAAPAQAMQLQPAKQFAACGGAVADILGLEPWYSCLQKKYGSIKIGELNDIWLIVLPLIEDLFKAGLYIATGFVIWGGFKHLKSQGDPGQLQQAREVIRNAIIGLLWLTLSVAIVEFVSAGIKSGTI